MKNGLWGHALLLASKMDSRTHARVMTRWGRAQPLELGEAHGCRELSEGRGRVALALWPHSL